MTNLLIWCHLINEMTDVYYFSSVNVLGHVNSLCFLTWTSAIHMVTYERVINVPNKIPPPPSPPQSKPSQTLFGSIIMPVQFSLCTSYFGFFNSKSKPKDDFWGQLRNFHLSTLAKNVILSLQMKIAGFPLISCNLIG